MILRWATSALMGISTYDWRIFCCRQAEAVPSSSEIRFVRFVATLSFS